MNATPRSHVVIKRGKLASFLLSGIAIGASSAVLAWGAWSTFAIADESIEQTNVIKSCRLPDAEGAMTVFVMEHGKLRCWRWK